MRGIGVGAAALWLTVVGCSFADEAKEVAALPSPQPCRETGLVTESRTAIGGGLPIHWDRPVGRGGRQFASIEDAARALRFDPLAPARIKPCEVLVRDVRSPKLTLRFEDPQFGIFHATQRKPELPIAQVERTLLGMAGSCAEQECEGVWSLTRLSDGREALLTLGRGTELAAHNIVFIDPSGIEVVIQGPPHTFKRSHAIAVANAFVEGAPFSR